MRKVFIAVINKANQRTRFLRRLYRTVAGRPVRA